MAGRWPAVRGGAGWRLATGAAALAIVFQLCGLYLPDPPLGRGYLAGLDKLQHALGFFLPVLLIPWADTLRRASLGRPPRARVLVIVVWVSLAHAVVSEVVQHTLLPDRTGDPLDVLADWSGVAVGGLVVGTVLTFRQLRRRRPGAPPEELADHG